MFRHRQSLFQTETFHSRLLALSTTEANYLISKLNTHAQIHPLHAIHYYF
jgi:hypothetical protein